MKWTYFPRNRKITDDLLQIISVFDAQKNNINSLSNNLVSDQVLAQVTNGLEAIGYKVEHSKRDVDKIKMPVLYGECGKVDLNFEVDAFNENTGIVVEVEAGRAVTNYQFLKVFFEACCMYDA